MRLRLRGVVVILLAIDPGSAGRGNATALFDGRDLIAVRFLRTHGAVNCSDPAVDTVLVERPELQGMKTRAARPQDLMSLCWSGALLAGMVAGCDGSAIVERKPSEWKGSEPKPMHHARAWQVLSDAERALLGGATTHRVILIAREKGALDRWSKAGVSYYPRAFDTHNLLDAVALGLTYLGRIKKVG